MKIQLCSNRKSKKKSALLGKSPLAKVTEVPFGWLSWVVDEKSSSLLDLYHLGILLATLGSFISTSRKDLIWLLQMIDTPAVEKISF